MFGPYYTAGCPSCSAITDGFNGFAVDLANHDVALSGYRGRRSRSCRRSGGGWGGRFPCASSGGSEFDSDFGVRLTEEQQRNGSEYNYRREDPWQPEDDGDVAAKAKRAGTDPATYLRPLVPPDCRSVAETSFGYTERGGARCQGSDDTRMSREPRLPDASDRESSSSAATVAWNEAENADLPSAACTYAASPQQA
jgi:Bacterial protein of unknown function (DUF899)